MAKHEKLGVFDRIKGWIGGLGSLAAGVFLYVGGVEEMVEEIPYHRELGMAFMGWGIVFILAMIFTGTEFGFRLSCLLLLVFACFFGGLAVIGTGQTIWGAWRLSTHGQEVQGVVTAAHRHQYKKNTSWTYTVRYANRTERISIDGNPKRGSRIRVLYLADDPEVVLAGVKGDSFFKLLDKSIGRWWALTAIGFTLAMVLLALVKLKQLLVGRSEAFVDGAEGEAG